MKDVNRRLREAIARWKVAALDGSRHTSFKLRNQMGHAEPVSRRVAQHEVRRPRYRDCMLRATSSEANPRRTHDTYTNKELSNTEENRCR